MKVVGISGWKRSGKDTVGSFLINMGYQKLSFADELKMQVSERFDIPLEWMNNQDMKELPIYNLPMQSSDDSSLLVLRCFAAEGATGDGKKKTTSEDSITFDNQGCALLNGEQLYWTCRALMIMQGTTSRSVDCNYWVDTVLKKVDLECDELFFISDLRYKSEASRLKEAFGSNFISVRVNRFEDSASLDASERDLDDYSFDYVIENKGSLQDLEQHVFNLFGV